MGMSEALLRKERRLVIISSYNTGRKLLETVEAALKFWAPVWVVIDGSTDESGEKLTARQAEFAGLRVISLPENRGKGAAVLAGFRAAREAGFEQALVMDADGQHPAECIKKVMDLAAQNPAAMILGVPQFAADAPASRKHGRRVGNWWANLETLWGGVQDSLFGFRVYPIAESLRILEGISGGRRYSFDTELAVRLYWRGVKPINVEVPVRYFLPEEGGVSHFKYVRDNLLLIWAHTWLVFGMVVRLPLLWKLRGRR
jgi:glycosyltransferase involved in cell wall biosynthesis